MGDSELVKRNAGRWWTLGELISKLEAGLQPTSVEVERMRVAMAGVRMPIRFVSTSNVQ